MKSKTSSPKRRPDGAIRALAEALEISTRRTHALLSEGMPDTPVEALAWRASRESSDSAEQLRQEKILLTRAQRQLREGELARLRGELIERADVRAQFAAIGSALAAMLTRLSREIPQACSGLPIEKALPKSREITRELQLMFCNKESEFWQEHPQVSSSTETTKTPRKTNKSKA